MSTAANPFPDSISSNFVETRTGLKVHYLEGGESNKPVVFLLHGFPELGYSWRYVIPNLIEAGYRAIAPDQRGFGKTTGGSNAYDVDLEEFSMDNLSDDIIALSEALGIKKLHAVIGHDFGSPVAATCALKRPDLFKRLVIMSSPHTSASKTAFVDLPLHQQLERLDQPRKHYQQYYTGKNANGEMTSGNLRNFLLAYFHMKSANWPGNSNPVPHPLPNAEAQTMATMPHYYIMPKDASMPESVLPHLPNEAPTWLPEQDLAYYVSEYQRTGFQGGLNWYRRRAINKADPNATNPLQGPFKVPCAYIAGKNDWGTFQFPRALDTLKKEFGVSKIYLIDNAGHWVQQEQAEVFSNILVAFLNDYNPSPTL